MSALPGEPGSIPPALVNRPSSWRFLLGAIGAAGSFRALVLAIVGLQLTVVGWGAIDGMSRNELGTIRRAMLGPRPEIERFEGRDAVQVALARSARTILDPIRVVSGPVGSLLAIDPGRTGPGRSIGAALWGLVVWGVIGGAIGRLAVGRLNPVGEPVGVWSAVRFMGRRLRSVLAAPLGVMVVVGLLAIPAVLIGLMIALGGAGAEAIGSRLLVVPLLLAIPSALLVILLLVGWPLMVLTVAVEGEDGFEAVSRTVSYLRQRAGVFVGSIVLSGAAGAVGLVLVSQLARLVVHLAGWGLAIGGPSDRIAPGFAWSGSGLGSWPAGWNGWRAGIGLVLHGWAFSFVWSAMARIYVVLRQDVDGTPWPDLYRPEAEDAEPFAPEPTNPAPSA
ncbi:hypothetical protein [Tautonia marina]|uniref:hypothetical protein n=1 Tax=Tautonia marina TaxID=2653855 RepID=UPI001260453C|nr:hypothetical protein [Tautonia marina]